MEEDQGGSMKPVGVCTEEVAKLIEALRPFAMQADTMWSHNGSVKVCGVEVMHYRRAMKLVREHELKEKGHAE
jgi:hypothetical protein